MSNRTLAQALWVRAPHLCGKGQPQELGGDAPTSSFLVKEWGKDRADLYWQSTNWPTNSLHQDAGSGCLDLGHGKKLNSLCFLILYRSMAAGSCCCWKDSVLPPCIFSSSGKQANSTLRENKIRQTNKITNPPKPKTIAQTKIPEPNQMTQHNKRKKEGNHHCTPHKALWNQLDYGY